MLIKNYNVPITLTCAFAFSVMAHGPRTMVGAATISTVALVVGVIYTLRRRITEGRPLIPFAFFAEPVVISSLIYFAIGLLSYFGADEPYLWTKEVVQRTMIILLPTILFTFMPKCLADIKFVILAYLPCCSVIALVAFYDGIKHGFAKPDFTLGMHKNHIAGSCSVLATIAIAVLLTTKDVKKRLLMIGLLGLGLGGCTAAQGKAGMVCIIVAALMMMLANGAKLKRLSYLVVSIVLVGAILWKVLPESAKDHVTSTKRHSTNEIRMTLWSDVLPTLVKEPFTAVGWGNHLRKGDHYYGDAANVVLYDWFQLTIIGAIALVSMIFFAVKLPLDNAKRIPRSSLLAFINLVALGVICGRFTHAMVDTFWIGRGVTLLTWSAIGIALFVKFYLDQIGAKEIARTVDAGKTQRNSARQPVLR